MRREGYELTVSRPEVILHTVEGETHEPYERVTIDIPPDYIGVVQQALAGRKGRLEQMSTDADGRARLEFIVPTRGLIGYRGQLLSDTRGTALMHQIGEGYGPMAGEVTHPMSGVLVADVAGDPDPDLISRTAPNNRLTHVETPAAPDCAVGSDSAVRSPGWRGGEPWPTSRCEP